MRDFTKWWFEKTQENRIIWESPPGRIGAGQLHTPQTLRYVNTEQAEIYLRVTTVETVPKHGRGGAKLAGEIPGVWLDIDHSTGLNKNANYPTPHQARDLLDELPDPSAMVNTGGGWHCYWKLAEPISTLDNLDFLACWWQKCSDIWQRSGFLLDNVLNPDRLLRMPGSINFKQDKFKTTWEVNDLEYSQEDLVADCGSIPLSVERNWVERPTLQTAFNEVVDASKIWEDQGFTKTGVLKEPSGVNYLRPGSGAEKSLTVWSDTNITTIHSTVVVDKLELKGQHIPAHDLAERLGVLGEWKDEADARLKVLTSDYAKDYQLAQEGRDTSSSRWHEAIQQELLQDRLLGLSESKRDLVQPFPSHLLPEIVNQACIDAAASTGAPIEMAYTTGLAALAIPVSGRIRVQLWDTPISLFTIVAAAPGAGKSPLLKTMIKGLRELDREAYKVWKPKSAMYRKKLVDLEDQIYKADKAGQDTEILEREFSELEKKTVAPNMILGKMTPAAMYEVLALKESAAVVSDEGADWLANFRDSNSSEVTGDALLEIYDGQPVHKATKTDGHVQVEATLSILLLTQSANLHRFSDLHKSGLWQRFLYVNLPDKGDVRRSKLEYETAESLETFQVWLTEIADLVDKWGQYIGHSIVKVSEEATEKFFDWEEHTKRRGHEKYPEFDERYGDNRLFEALSKCHSHALRIAGLLAIVRCVETSEVPTINLDDITSGIGIASWFYDRRVADSLGDVMDRESGRLKDLLKILEYEPSITATELGRQSHYFERGNTQETTAWLSKLVEEGLLVERSNRRYAKSIE